MSAVGHAAPPTSAVTRLDEHGLIKATFQICGQTAVLEGHVVALERHMVRFFDLAETLVQHNIEVAKRSLAAQERALELRALAGANVNNPQ